jgi:hypothetical protein
VRLRSLGAYKFVYTVVVARVLVDAKISIASCLAIVVTEL